MLSPGSDLYDLDPPLAVSTVMQGTCVMPGDVPVKPMDSLFRNGFEQALRLPRTASVSSPAVNHSS